ncbi:succinoglycan biosynthesis protein exop [Rhizobium rhizogenes]|uniref:succinoglycan biosynthesis protein exop n=1 Tax=Rhizobium rhizogenes TaxID=359 RepID=UPI0004DA795A|nr:succinoglycan biosynthesis protein exop [Rhizobium rhizogenes]KEA05286.1 succinoglycan biosynthesis protein exop [Rhizobium rhizogenes]MQB33470.1 succinoglycan biosynthesis protein exop [Rhizobium rhizogenes]NTH17519.1 succinoglycan biosynthesis protein exop [Rhizobium rhizogenes]NTH30492.1 succinoglycan biosynthesis protein exop [Rhizobium rhizogenes]NTI79623.1 succinoglycan biosynthesis protein exop [Rhizobium rhizogenes]
MFEDKARTRPHPVETEALEASGGAVRHAYFDRGEDGYLIAANLQPADRHAMSDAQLLTIIQKMLDGDPYPVSGQAKFLAVEAEQPQPLPDRIRDILRNRPAVDEAIADGEPAPTAYDPPVALHVDDAAVPLSSPMAIPAVAPAPQRRRAFGLGSIAFVVAASLVGAFVPTMLASPPRYASQAVLRVEGQGFLDVATKRIVVPSLLSDLVARLKLDRDPEFTGGHAGAFGVAMDLLSGNGNASDAPSRAQATLRNDIAVTADAQSGTLHLTVTTGNPMRAAEIANRLADATIYDAMVAQGVGLTGKSNTPADRSLKNLEQAKAALADFKAQYGDDKIAAALDLQAQRQRLDGEIKASEAAVLSAKARASAARSATPATVMSGALPGDLSSAGLDDLRSRYSAAKIVLSQLSTQLGPRHPRLLAQQATVDSLAGDIRNQLQRLVASSDAALKTALEDQAKLTARMSALGQKTVDVDMARLAQLQDDVVAAQSRYDADLQSVDATPPEVAPPVTVLAPATAAKAPLDDDLAGRQIAGFLIGLGVALCLVFLRKWVGGELLLQDRAAGAIAVPELLFDPEADSVSDFPEPHLDEAIPVADDQPIVTDELTQIQRELALLRAKVETYAAHRRTGRG